MKKQKQNRRVNTRVWFVVAIAMLLFASFTFAFDASSSSLNSTGKLGSGTYSSNSSGIIITGILGSGLSGRYSGGSIDGSFMLNASSEVQNMTFKAISPVNLAIQTTRNTTFRFNITYASATSCSLYLDDALSGSSFSPSQGSNQLLRTDLSTGLHKWNVTCQDSTGLVKSTGNRLFRTIVYSNFDNGSTDLSNVNISDVVNFTIAKSGIGNVIFLGSTDLSAGYDLDSNIRITGTSIIVNSSALPVLNKSARLTINNIPYANVAILKDGEPCQDCVITSNSGGIVTFLVNGFSNYTVTSNARLHIFDSTDLGNTYVNNQVFFFANYTNVTSGSFINANCDIDLDSQINSMTFNASSNLYYYNRSFNTTGSYAYNVTCTPIPPGFDTLSVFDSAQIMINPQEGLAIVVINQTASSRMNESLEAENFTINAGDITPVLITTRASSNSWQGVYGQISGEVTLETTEGDKFYDWTDIVQSGEVFATRTSTVNWAQLRCAYAPDLVIENNLIGLTSNSSDSIFNTFNTSIVAPAFNVLGVPIDVNSGCYATNLYRSNAQVGNFTEILLHDDSQVIYTSLISPDQEGFNGNNYDFQMLIGLDGQAENSTTYYFFMEI